MNNTKKGFMYAGGILGIIAAVSCIILGVIALIATSVIDFNFVNELIAEMNATATTAEELIVLTEAQIHTVVRISRVITVLIGLFTLGLGIANLVLSKKVIKLGAVCSNKKGAVIALLVLSVLIGNLITMAFMITALCLRFEEQKPNEDIPAESFQEIAQ